MVSVNPMQGHEMDQEETRIHLWALFMENEQTDGLFLVSVLFLLVSAILSIVMQTSFGYINRGALKSFLH